MFLTQIPEQPKSKARTANRPGRYWETPTYCWQPAEISACTRDWNSGDAMKDWRTCWRVRALLFSWLIQNCTPARSPPRRRKVLYMSATKSALLRLRAPYSGLVANPEEMLSTCVFTALPGLEAHCAARNCPTQKLKP